MCVVLQHHLGKGTRCASPLHPPGLCLIQGIEPFMSQHDRIVGQPLARRLRSPCTHRSKGVPALVKS